MSCGELGLARGGGCRAVCRRGGPEAQSSEGRRWAPSRSVSGPGSGGREAGGPADPGEPGELDDLDELGEADEVGGESVWGWDWSRRACRDRWTAAGGGDGEDETWPGGRD